MRAASSRSRHVLCVVKLAFTVVQCIAMVTSATPSSSSLPTNYVIDSLECRARSSCHGQPNEDDPDEEGISLTADDRNCRCDDKCGLYDDCCHDYRAPATNDSASLKAVVNCLSAPEVDPTGPIYMVNRCPDIRQADDVTKRRCEVGVPTGDGFQLNRLPVIGDDTGALYRNAFCAACNGERDRKYVYWVARVTLCAASLPAADVIHRENISEILTAAVNAGCQITFHPDHIAAKYRLTGSTDDVDKSSSSSLWSTRRCRPRVLGRCDRNWLDRPTSRMCREGPTGYVYAGLRTFRNRHCAVCNHVNETYLRCTADNQTRNGHGEADRFSSRLDNTEPYVLIDMNGKNAVLHSTQSSIDEDDEDFDVEDDEDLPTFQFPVCTDGGKLYDPFSGRCVQPPSTCRPGSIFRLGRCENDENGAQQNIDDVITKVVARSTINERDGDDSDDNDDVTQSTTPAAGSPAPTGDLAEFKNSNSSAKTSATLRSPLSFRPFRLLMFRLSDLERFASIVGTLVGTVAYVAALIGACAFRRSGPLDRGSHGGSDTAARCFVCLMVCLFLRHLGYLAVVTGVSLQEIINSAIDSEGGEVPVTSRVCFYATAALQYFSLAAFFWLNVLTVEVYRRLSSSSLKWLIHPSIDFVFYSLFAWTMPALAVGWSIAVELLGVDAWTPRGVYLSDDGDAPTSTEPPTGSLSRRPSDCFVLGFIQLLLLVLPAALITVVDVALLVVTGCRKCFRRDAGDDEDEGTIGKSSPSKKIAPVDDNLPHPWRRNIPDTHSNDDADFEKCGESSGTRSRRRRAENLYVCCVQLTLLLSMTWALCFMASTLPGAPHPLLWYLYIIFDVALAVTASIAFLTTEHRIWLRLTTRRRRWNRLLSEDGSTHKLPRRAAGQGDVIVVEAISGWPAPGSPTTSTSAVAGPDSPISAGASTGEHIEATAEQKDGDSLKLLMKETSI